MISVCTQPQISVLQLSYSQIWGRLLDYRYKREGEHIGKEILNGIDRIKAAEAASGRVQESRSEMLERSRTLKKRDLTWRFPSRVGMNRSFRCLIAGDKRLWWEMYITPLQMLL